MDTEQQYATPAPAPGSGAQVPGLTAPDASSTFDVAPALSSPSLASPVIGSGDDLSSGLPVSLTGGSVDAFGASPFGDAPPLEDADDVDAAIEPMPVGPVPADAFEPMPAAMSVAAEAEPAAAAPTHAPVSAAPAPAPVPVAAASAPGTAAHAPAVSAAAAVASTDAPESQPRHPEHSHMTASGVMIPGRYRYSHPAPLLVHSAHPEKDVFYTRRHAIERSARLPRPLKLVPTDPAHPLGVSAANPKLAATRPLVSPAAGADEADAAAAAAAAAAAQARSTSRAGRNPARQSTSAGGPLSMSGFSESATQLDPVLRRCETLLTTVMDQPYAHVFSQPVDPQRDGVPNYFDVVKKPMDLGTVRARLLSGKYDHLSHFSEDVRQVFINATTFNPAGNWVHGIAVKLSDVFESKLKDIEAYSVQYEQQKAQRKLQARRASAAGGSRSKRGHDDDDDDDYDDEEGSVASGSGRSKKARRSTARGNGNVDDDEESHASGMGMMGMMPGSEGMDMAQMQQMWQQMMMMQQQQMMMAAASAKQQQNKRGSMGMGMAKGMGGAPMGMMGMNPMMMGMMNPMMMGMMNPMMGGMPGARPMPSGQSSGGPSGGNKRASGMGVAGKQATPSGKKITDLSQSVPAAPAVPLNEPVGPGPRVDELRLDMQKLAPESLQGVVTILQHHDPLFEPQNGSIHIDLAQLSNAAFSDLESYVQNCLKPQPAQQPSIFKSPAAAFDGSGRGATPLGVGLGVVGSPANIGIGGGATQSDSDSDLE